MTGDDARTGAVVSASPDPRVWLTGPVEPGSSRAARRWLDEARQTLCTDFELAPGSPEATYVGDVLSRFVDADLGEFRFLRMRALGDAPVAARLDLAVHEQGADPLLTYGEDVEWYDHRPALEVVDAATGLRRSSRVYVDDGVRVVVRHHRLVDGVDVVLSVAGYDLRTTAGVLPDLVGLIESVELSQTNGVGQA